MRLALSLADDAAPNPSIAMMNATMMNTTVQCCQDASQ
jgi:hypothetical protein